MEKIKSFFSSNFFFANPVNRWLFIAGFLANILVWVLWSTEIVPVSNQVYLPTEIPIDNLRPHTLPILGSFFFLINFVLAYYACKKEILISFYLLSTSILIEILILVLIRQYLIIT